MTRYCEQGAALRWREGTRTIQPQGRPPPEPVGEDGHANCVLRLRTRQWIRSVHCGWIRRAWVCVRRTRGPRHGRQQARDAVTRSAFVDRRQMRVDQRRLKRGVPVNLTDRSASCNGTPVELTRTHYALLELFPVIMASS